MYSSLLARFARRGVSASSGPGSVVPQFSMASIVSWEMSSGSRGVAGVEAGSLLLANGGICCLGDIDSYSKVDLERLKSTLEMKQVSYERPRSQSRRKKESAETAFDRQPLHCAVWAVMSLAGNTVIKSLVTQ